MDAGQWIALGSVLVTVVITSLSWIVARRGPSERDRIRQDIEILNALPPGTARLRLADSIDERVYWLAMSAERRRPQGALGLGFWVVWVGLSVVLLGYFSDWTWLRTPGWILSMSGWFLGILGSHKFLLDEEREYHWFWPSRLTPRRRPEAAADGAPPQTPAPAAPGSTPTRPGSPG